jgi:pyridinium-3,5-biscarboxylic acid mononucleotide synthase
MDNKEICSMIVFDDKRKERIGLPEAVFCAGKPIEAIKQLVSDLEKKNKPVLFTRLENNIYEEIGPSLTCLLNYHPISRTAFLNGTYPKSSKYRVAIITAGTSDTYVAWETGRTLEYLGIENTIIEDIGVAGLWRLESRIGDITNYDVLIVVAGMDAALCSVVGGLTGKPVIGVPTSTGYGVADGGRSALNSMLTSCSAGIMVMNIDNGYGAACAAVRIIQGRASE